MEDMGSEDYRAGEAALRARLGHVYWLGGASGAGKSTVARRLAVRYGWRLYPTDDVMADHGTRTAPGECPMLRRFAAMSMDERWVTRSPRTMLETFHWFRGEAFGPIVEDLAAMPSETCVIAEGFRLLPRLVKPLLAVPGHAVWLLPTPDFRRTAFERRPWPREMAAKTSDPGRALRNLLERDRMFTECLRQETKRLGVRVLEVDTSMTEDDLARQVAAAFGHPCVARPGWQ